METWVKIILAIAAIVVFIFVMLPILVIVLAGTIFLINPTQIGTSGCTGFEKLPISNYNLNPSGLEIQVTNQTGRTINDVIIQGSFDGGSFINSVEYTGTEAINSNAVVDVTWAGQTLASGDYTIDMTLSYNDGDYTRTATASCQGTI